MSATLDMERIAKELGAERRGKVSPRGGYFGALQLAAEVSARFRVPEGGGRATDPSWSEQRLVRLSPKTLEQLEKLAKEAHASPMQVAALLLERAVQIVGGQEKAG
jgi:hypothetical protein